ncbi:hypothetical protein D3C86_1989560 [compost metagenome]
MDEAFTPDGKSSVNAFALLSSPTSPDEMGTVTVPDLVSAAAETICISKPGATISTASSNNPALLISLHRPDLQDRGS